MTRRPAPEDRPVALTIAGSDSGGGAGIQADLKTMEAHGVFATSVITAVTAQNTLGVRASDILSLDLIEAQIKAVLEDFDVLAVKTGMLASADVIELVESWADHLETPFVIDPVMVAAAGDRLLEEEAEGAYEALLSHASLVTPNADEAEVLTGVEVRDEKTAIEAGEALVDRGADSALVKGGHVESEHVMDVFVTPGGSETLTHSRIETQATHGSGCTLSSAITAAMANGKPLEEAVQSGVAFMERAVRYPLAVGTGPGAVHHLVELRDLAHREPTAEAVEGVVERFVDADVSRLIPEVGMNVVGATRYAETARDTAAVEGRITRTLSGCKPNRGVRFGASSHVARFLLAAREFDPALRFAVNCRFDEEIETALSALDGPVTEFDRGDQPSAVMAEEGRTMAWGARHAFEKSDGTPVAVIDRGAVGKEAIVKLLAADPRAIENRTLTVLASLSSDPPSSD